MDNLYDYIKKCASRVGFDLCGVVELSPMSDQASYLDGWIDRGYGGTMEWMAANRDKREDLTAMVDGAKTVVVCALSYLSYREVSMVSRYAIGVDYHYLIKSMLEKMASSLSEYLGREFSYRLFTDSAPLFERQWAVRAGLGWIGRNKMLINREYGSYTLLGELVCDISFDRYDKEEIFNGCGSCDRCQRACPGGALKSDGLDSRLCSSYLTIEHSGDFTPSQQQIVSRSGYIFGCDICQDVCPWNIKAKRSLTTERQDKVVDLFRIEQCTTPLTPQQWREVVEVGFRSMFKGRPMLRAGKRKIARNLMARE